MKQNKYLIAFVAILLIPIIFWLSMIILDKINPPYIILENGERGYLMATENILFSALFSIGIPILIAIILYTRKVNKNKA